MNQQSDMVAAGPAMQTGSGDKARFTIERTLAEGWRLVCGSKGVYLGAFIYMLLAYLAVGLVVLLLGSVFGKQAFVVTLIGAALQLVVGAVTSAGLLMLGVKRARGQDIRSSMIFDPASRWGTLTMVSIAVPILCGIGFVLLIIPGLYLLVSYLFAYPLVTDRGLGVWEAMEESRKAVTKRWFSVCGLLIIMAVVLAVSTILFVIPLLWTGPWCYNSYGIVYRKLFES